MLCHVNQLAHHHNMLRTQDTSKTLSAAAPKEGALVKCSVLHSGPEHTTLKPTTTTHPYIHNFEGAQHFQINESSFQSAGGNIVTYHNNTFIEKEEHGQSNVERERRY